MACYKGAAGSAPTHRRPRITSRQFRQPVSRRAEPDRARRAARRWRATPGHGARGPTTCGPRTGGAAQTRRLPQTWARARTAPYKDGTHTAYATVATGDPAQADP